MSRSADGDGRQFVQYRFGFDCSPDTQEQAPLAGALAHDGCGLPIREATPVAKPMRMGQPARRLRRLSVSVAQGSWPHQSGAGLASGYCGALRRGGNSGSRISRFDISGKDI